MRLLLALLLLLLSLPAQAMPPAPAEGTVTRVTIEGNRRIEDATVLASIFLRSGQTLSAEAVRRDIRNIYRTGFFDDIRVETIVDGDGVQVVFVVDEKPAVRDVKIVGNKKVDEEDIREVIDIRTFAVLNAADVKSNVERIRDLYVEKGYYLVEVEDEVTWVADDQVELSFRIEEHKKVVVQQIEFHGNDTVPTSKIRRYMQTKAGGIVPWLTNSGTFRREMLEADREVVRSVFLEEGFVDVQVDEPKVYLSPDKRYIFVSFQIHEGPRYTIGSIDARGDFIEEEGLIKDAVLEIAGGTRVADVQDRQWRAHTGRGDRLLDFPQKGPSVKPGDPFKLSTVLAVVGSISDFYADQGYAFVNVVPQPITDEESKTVSVEFLIDKGEKVRIGRINISGNDPTFDKVIRRELQIDEGEVYRGARIKASRARLERLGYFEEVNISTPRGEGEDVLDLNIQVAEQPTGSFSLGLGFSNLEQFVFTASVSKNNFLGLGYVMSASVNWSAVRRQWQLQFFDPYFLDSRWTLRVNGYNITRKFQLDEYQRGGSFEVGRYLDQRDDWRVAVEYTIEDVGLTSLEPFRGRMLGGDLYRNGLTSTVGVTLNVDKRNNRIKATKGVFSSASVSLSGGFRVDDEKLLSLLGGQFNFVEARYNLRFFQPLVPNTDLFVVRINSTLGGIWSTDGTVIPFIHRFRAGGINSVRGFNWFSLGPTIRSLETEDPIRADDRLVVGGTETWVNNFEIETPIVRQAGIAAVVFFDAGNAFGDPWGNGHMSPLGLRTAYGAGVRWQSPIGPLRFEYGFPVKPLEGEKKSVFDFSIGSFF
jgi:outer membrane protein insertion porin family